MLTTFKGFLERKPTQDFFDAAKPPPYTPDWRMLAQADHWLLFEYSELKIRMPNYSVLASPHVADAFTAERYCVLKKTQGINTFALAAKSFPIPKVPRARIRGEIYKVPYTSFAKLDAYRQNGVQFERVRVPLVYPFQSIRTSRKGHTFLENSRGEAWMYLAKSEAWKTEMDWDYSFYKGRDGSMYKPLPRTHPDNNPFFNAHFNFLRSDLEEHKPRCFMHCHQGLNDPTVKQAA